MPFPWADPRPVRYPPDTVVVLYYYVIIVVVATVWAAVIAKLAT